MRKGGVNFEHVQLEAKKPNLSRYMSGSYRGRSWSHKCRGMSMHGNACPVTELNFFFKSCSNGWLTLNPLESSFTQGGAGVGAGWRWDTYWVPGTG